MICHVRTDKVEEMSAGTQPQEKVGINLSIKMLTDCSEAASFLTLENLKWFAGEELAQKLGQTVKTKIYSFQFFSSCCPSAKQPP